MTHSSSRGRWGARLRTRFSLLSLSLGIAFGVVPLAVAPLAVSADGPTGVTFSLMGCNGSESLLPASGPYVCPDADYSAGNQGKDWNELDLVPMRLSATAGASAPASQTYQVATVAGFMDNGHPGFDYQSVPVLNTSLSDASCTAAVASGIDTFSPGLNNADTSIFRVLSITQSAGSTCVYDYYQRLALGSSAYPGSSLHSDLGTVTMDGSTVTGLASIPGVKTVPLPVNPSTAPSLGAGVSATQGQGYVWTVAKQPSASPLGIADTCNPEGRSQSVDVTVSWQRQVIDQGQTVVVESVYAANSTGRTLIADATATLDDATHTQVAQDSTGDVSVPANSSHYLLASFTHQFASGASSSYSTAVSGGYTDPVTHTAVGSGLVASASSAVQTVTSNANASAVVTDVSSISGSGLQYAINSVTGPAGSLGGYVLGTATGGSVTWTSPSLTGNGSVVLHETVIAAAGSAGTGSLDDVANVAGSGGFATGINLQVPVTTGALFDLAIHTTIPDVLQGAETAAFHFTATDSHGTATPATVALSAGQTAGSTTLSGLAAGAYTVHEATASGWVAQPDQVVTLAGAGCAGSVSFANSVVPAVATVQKVTLPAGHEAGWSFSLVGPGAPAGGEKVTTTGPGAVAFTTPLQEGAYTIVESSTRDGWVQGSTTGCSFTVDYPADAGRSFACTITNVQAAVTTPATPAGPAGGVQGVAVTTPNTGADLPYGEAGLLLLAGGTLAGYGWRRGRRTAR